MAGFSIYLANNLINETLRNINYVPVATHYLALFTTNPTPNNTGIEVSGGSYVRKPITFIAPTNGVTSNSATVTFPAATAPWGTVTHFGIYDALTTGNLLYYHALDITRSILAGDSLSVPIGNISVTLE